MMTEILKLTKQVNDSLFVAKSLIELVKENKKLKDELDEFKNYRERISKEFLEKKEMSDFLLQVQVCSTNDDFQKNAVALASLKPSDFNVFLDLIKYGSGISNSLKCLEKIKQTAVESKLTIDEIVDLLGKFRLINNYLNK